MEAGGSTIIRERYMGGSHQQKSPIPLPQQKGERQPFSPQVIRNSRASASFAGGAQKLDAFGLVAMS